MEMAHSVEGRVPFLDHHVVECVCRAPVSLKIRGVTEKYLLREAAQPLITETVYRRQKHPFLSPPVTTVPTERFHEMMQDTLRGPALGSLPFYDRKKVVALLDQLPAMSDSDRVGWDPVLMSVLSACVIHERFGLDSKDAENDAFVIRSLGGIGTARGQIRITPSLEPVRELISHRTPPSPQSTVAYTNEQNHSLLPSKNDGSENGSR